MSDSAVQVAIVGAGFGGLCMAARLKRTGIDSFIVLERSADVGGVWWNNSYPGAACDLESRLYSFSFAQDFAWSRSHGTRDEILAYLRHCVTKFDLSAHLRLGVDVEEARFNQERSLWLIRTAAGEEIEAKTLVSACGLFNRPSIPDIPGADTFPGPRFHSARWDHGFDPTGKCVAIIGGGCSAAQFTPAIAPLAKSIAMFMRTPTWVTPRFEAMDSRLYRWLMRAAPLRRLDRWRTYLAMERGFAVQKSAEVRSQREAAALAFLAREVKDEAKRRKLTPNVAIGCKRNIRSSDFLAALDRPNVEIVTDAITRIDGRFIETRNGQRIEADALIYGTGFTTQEFLSTLRVVGPDGRDLHAAWQGAPEAYLGMTVAGFPNFFMIYGPNTNAMNSIVFMIECQAGYILQAIRALTRGRACRIDVRAETQARFNAELQAELRDTSWMTGCVSYFMNAAGRIVTQWPKATRFYWMRTRRLNPRDFTMET